MKKLLLTGFALVAVLAQAQNSWVPQGTKFDASFGVDEMVIVDANTVWINAYDGSSAGTYPKAVSRTVNGGTSWTANNVSGPGTNSLASDLAAVDANTAWLATAGTSGSPNSNAIWKTTNGGSSWTRQTIGYTGASFTNIVYFWDANTGFTAGDPKGTGFEAYRTTNGGTTWTAVTGLPAPTSIGGTTGEYGLTGAKAVSGNHIWFGTSKGRIFHSPDKGVSWTANFSPALDFGAGPDGGGVAGSFAKMAFKDGNNGILIAVDGSVNATMYTTTDGGATWGDPMTPTGTWFFGDITYVPGTANTYVTTGANPNAAQGTGSAYSTDGGLSWTVIDNIPAIDGGQRGKVKFFNATTGWAGFFSDGPTGSEGIFKFSGNLALATSETAVKSNLKVYPNPATDVVNVTSNKKIESVNIIDLAGKRVDGAQGSQINVSKLPKGTYILQVYYGGGAVENTKLIKK